MNRDRQYVRELKAEREKTCAAAMKGIADPMAWVEAAKELQRWLETDFEPDIAKVEYSENGCILIRRLLAKLTKAERGE